jgi:hypothetical protein
MVAHDRLSETSLLQDEFPGAWICGLDGASPCPGWWSRNMTGGRSPFALTAPGRRRAPATLDRNLRRAGRTRRCLNCRRKLGRA